MSEAMKCPRCDSPVHADAKFCGNCGCPLVLPEIIPDATASDSAKLPERHCPNCAAIVGEHNAFCGSCGQRLNSSEIEYESDDVDDAGNGFVDAVPHSARATAVPATGSGKRSDTTLTTMVGAQIMDMLPSIIVTAVVTAAILAVAYATCIWGSAVITWIVDKGYAIPTTTDLMHGSPMQALGRFVYQHYWAVVIVMIIVVVIVEKRITSARAIPIIILLILMFIMWILPVYTGVRSSLYSSGSDVNTVSVIASSSRQSRNLLDVE